MLAGREVPVPSWLGSCCLARHEGSGVAGNILGQENLPAPGPRRLLRICNVLPAINLGLVTVLNNHFADFSIDCLAFVVLLRGHSSFLGYFSSLFHTWHWDNNIAFDYGLGSSPAHTLEYITRLCEPCRAQFTEKLVNGSVHLWGWLEIHTSKVPLVVSATHCSPSQHHPGHPPSLLTLCLVEGVTD